MFVYDFRFICIFSSPFIPIFMNPKSNQSTYHRTLCIFSFSFTLVFSSQFFHSHFLIHSFRFSSPPGHCDTSGLKARNLSSTPNRSLVSKLGKERSLSPHKIPSVSVFLLLKSNHQTEKQKHTKAMQRHEQSKTSTQTLSFFSIQIPFSPRSFLSV